MSRPRGRPRLPPKTDPGEIRRSCDEKDAEARARAAAMYPAPGPPQPTEPIARAAAVQAEWARVTGQPVPSPSAVGEKANRALEVNKGQFPGRGWLTAEELKFLAAKETSPNAIMAKSLPPRPAWVEEAFIASIAAVKEIFGSAASDCNLPTPELTLLMLEPTEAGLLAIRQWPARQGRASPAGSSAPPRPWS